MKNLYTLCALLFLAISFDSYGQFNPSLQWQKCLGGSGDDKAMAILSTPDGGYIVAGTSNSNDGDVTGHHGTTSTTDGWVVKVSAAGAIDWQRSYGGSANDAFQNIIATQDGGYICFGSSFSTDGDVTGNHGQGDIWVVKINASGVIQWQKALGGSGMETPGNIRMAADGSLYIIGSTKSNDGDVSGNHQFYDWDTNQYIYNYDIWVVSLSNTGTVLSQHCYGGVSNDLGNDIVESNNGSIVVLGELVGESEFGQFYGDGAYIIKINSSHQGLWVETNIPGVSRSLTKKGNNFVATYEVPVCRPLNSGPSIENAEYDFSNDSYHPYPLTFTRIGPTDPCDEYFDGSYNAEGVNSYLYSDILGNLNVCTSPDTVSGHHGYYDGVFSSYTSSQNIRKKAFGGSGFDHFVSITGTASPNEWLICGYTNSNNGDVSGNHGGYDFWVVKLGDIVNQVVGLVYKDVNSNGVKDANEPVMNNVLVKSKKGASSIASSTQNGFFKNVVDTGTYQTSVQGAPTYYTYHPASHTSTFTTYGNKDSVAFGLQPIPGKKDYWINLNYGSYWTENTDVILMYSLSIRNMGTDTLQNTPIVFIKDPRFELYQPEQAPISQVGDTILWDPGVVLPGEFGDGVFIQLKQIAPIASGDTITVKAYIDSTGDETPSDNISIKKIVADEDFYPYYLSEASGGSITLDELASGKYLTYTVRFQQAGESFAKAEIRDTLPGNVLASTLEVMDASHPYQLTIRDSSKCSWVLTNNTTPGGRTPWSRAGTDSSGYIIFRVKPKSNLVAGDVIINQATIYIDDNTPVQTPPAITRIEAPAPLPVDLISFEGKLVNTAVELTWKTVHESKLATSQVQRSANGADFTTIGTVQPNNNANGATYHFTDKEPAMGNNHYRLRIVNMDGSAELSDIVVVKVDKELTLTTAVYPNPAPGGQATLEIKGKLDGPVLVSVLDQSGRRVATQQYYQANLYRWLLALPVKGLPAGQYIIEVRIGEITKLHKLVIQ